MGNVQWWMRGPSYSNCNCDTGCPCQFNALPTHGDCRAIHCMRIDAGEFDGVDLSGICWAATWGWPGAVHEGRGSQQSFIDEFATAEQQAALIMILRGEEAAEGMSIFQVYSTTIETFHEPQFVPIEVDIDIEARTALVDVPGVIHSVGEPIRNATTGEAQEVSVSMPGGFEYKVAEFGQGATKAEGVVPLDFEGSHGQWCVYHFNQDGVVA